MPDAPGRPDAVVPTTARRAEAWVHGVLNPLMDTLPNEVVLLEGGNITFNCDTGGLRHIRRVEESLTAPARHVLRDFLRANADAEEPIRVRDAAVGQVVTRARAAYRELQQREAFRTAVRGLPEARGEPAPSVAAELAGPPSAKVDPDRLTRAFGEFVVNRRGRMTDFESAFAPIWNRERERLLAHRAGDAFAKCDQATTGLLEADRHLVAWLQDKSFELCERHDIAAAPVGEGR